MRSTSISTTTSSSPSITAFLTMAGFKIALEKCYSNLFDSDELKLVNHIINTAISAEPSYIKWSLEKSFVSLPYFAQQGFLNRGISPAFDAHKIGRKLMIKNKIEDAISKDNIEQIIFLNGGYDTRPYLSSKKFPSIQFYEFDNSDTRNIKINALMQIPQVISTETFEVNYSPSYTRFNDNLHLIEYNPDDDLNAILNKSGFSKDKKTLIIVEDLTPQLSSIDNQKLIEMMFNLLEDGEEVLISYRAMLTNPLTITDKILMSSNESLKFSLLPRRVTEYVNTKGFEITGKMLCSDLIRWVNCQITHMSPQQTIPRGDNYYLLKRNAALITQKTQTIIDINNIPLIIDAEVSTPSYKSSGCTLL